MDTRGKQSESPMILRGLWRHSARAMECRRDHALDADVAHALILRAAFLLAWNTYLMELHSGARRSASL
jgi:hypothetical protein